MLGSMEIKVDSDLNGENPQFTLTCTSIGGPATYVTWTRDSVVVTGGNITLLNDAVNENYTHTLTVTERLPGFYNCTVANGLPSMSSRTLLVEGCREPFLFKNFTCVFLHCIHYSCRCSIDVTSFSRWST